MVRKYKLIKKYPGSPELGTIIKSPYYETQKGDTNTMIGGLCLEDGTYSEFWEEIKEKEYEVLTLEYKGSPQGEDKYCYLDSDGYYKYKDKLGSAMGSSLEGCLKTGWSIYSIKRVSDGEVFTIGYNVDSTISDLGRPTDITGFKIIDNKLTVGLRHLGYYPLSTIILPKKPLFTTEDGIDIFKYDKFYFVAEANWAIGELIANNNVTACMAKARFNSKEAAEKWIDENKPKYSKKDILKVIDDVHNCYNGKIQYIHFNIFRDYFKAILRNDKT